MQSEKGSEVTGPSGEGQAREAPMLAAQMSAVYRHAPIVHGATALVGIVTVFVMYPSAHPHVLLGWVAAVLALSALRLVDYLRYTRGGSVREQAQAWARRYLIGSTASGLLWGFAAAAFYLPGSELHQAYILLVIGGLVAAASVTHSVFPPAFYGFAMPALLALAGRVVLELWSLGDDRSFAIAQGVLVGWYLFALHRLSGQVFERFVEAYRAQRDIEALAGNLLAQKQAAERSNRELSAEIERRRALEAALHESRQRLGTALANVPAIVWVTDLEGRFTLLEGKGLASLERATQRWLGRSAYDAFPEPCGLGQAIRAALIGRESAFSAPYEGRTFQTFAGPMREPDGRIVGALGVSLDVSEREQMKELQRFRASLEASAEAIFLVDRETLRFIDFNETARRMLGYEREELLTLGPPEVILNPAGEELGAAYDGLAERTPGERAADPEVRLVRRKDGSLFPAELVRRAFWSGSERLVVTVLRDISDRIATQERLKLAYQALDTIAEGVLVTDAKGVIVWVNPSFERLTGCPAREAIGHTPVMLKSGRHDAAFYQSIYASLMRDGAWQGEIWTRAGTGEVVPHRVSISSMRDDSGSIVNFVAIFSDISMEKHAEQRIQFLATHDALTGLPNRTLFWDELQSALLRAKRDRTSVAVFFVDLDEFKRTNDTLGHLAGDEVLKAVAQRLRGALRETDLVGRLGGDEFAVAVEHLTDPREVEPLAQKILRSLALPCKLADGNEISVTPSIGISVFPRDGKDVETLLKHSDVAMYRAKSDGRNCYRFFSFEMTRHHLENLRMEAALRRALEGQELRLSYQPRVDARTGALVGVESLVRWNHPEFGEIPVERLIRLAEDTGLIYPLGERVLLSACTQAKQWQESGQPVPRVAVNVSAKQFRDPSLIERVTGVLNASRLAPEHLEIEVTESSVMADLEVAGRVLAALAGLGVHLTLDDFGTGHSSLAYLQRFPIGSIKIDRSFVADIESDRSRAQLAHAVITLGHSLGLRVVAEGVERRAQLRFLQDRRCDEMQGYLIAAPMFPDQLLQWMARQAAAFPAESHGESKREPHSGTRGAARH
jgi:diguanylate cyclase (GGDEF)-like protein/PAS domain S-box-containing protein